MIKYNLNLSPPHQYKDRLYNLHTMQAGKTIQGWQVLTFPSKLISNTLKSVTPSLRESSIKQKMNLQIKKRKQQHNKNELKRIQQEMTAK